MTRRRRRLLLLAGLVVFVAAALILHPVRLVSGSMRPTLDEGDICLAVRGGLGDLQRDELVLLDEPDLDQFVVKRIAGLPSERVQIIGDDLFVNGQRLQREVASVTDLVPLVDVAGQAADKHFLLAESGFQLDGAHWRLGENEEARASVRQPPTDGFLLGHEWHEGQRRAEELGIAVQFVLDSERAWFELELQEQGDIFRVVVEDGGSMLGVYRDGRDRARLDEVPIDPPVQAGTLFIANVDQVLVAVLNGEVLFRHGYGDTAARPLSDVPPDEHFTRVALRGLGPLSVQHIRVGRDFVRIASGTYGCAEALHLGHDEYFVLGDNPHISRDSRQFGPVSKDRLRGRLLGRLWPPGGIDFGWQD